MEPKLYFAPLNANDHEIATTKATRDASIQEKKVAIINNPPKTNLTATTNAPTNTPAATDNGVKARGVGSLKKKFLWVTKQFVSLTSRKHIAQKKHNTQLNDLKSQIRTSCGERGLAVLTKKLANHKWDRETKVFSKKNLTTLRTEVRTTLSENDKLAKAHEETLLTQKVEQKTSKLLCSMFGHDHQTRNYDEERVGREELFQELQDLKSKAAVFIENETVAEVAANKEKRINDKFEEIFSGLSSDVTTTMKDPEATQFVESIRTKNALQVDFEFLQAVKPYSSGAVKASPQEVNNLVAIVEKFISDGENFDEFSENSIINLDAPRAEEIQQACKDLKKESSDAEKTAKAETLITKLGGAQEYIQKQVFNDKFDKTTIRDDIQQIAETIVEREILVTNRQELGLD